jgi:hypothetical protein
MPATRKIQQRIAASVRKFLRDKAHWPITADTDAKERQWAQEHNATSRAAIKASVWEGDPHGWSAGAACTVGCEFGIAVLDYYSNYEVVDEINDHLTAAGLACTVEWVNAGVICIHWEG